MDNNLSITLLIENILGALDIKATFMSENNLLWSKLADRVDYIPFSHCLPSIYYETEYYNSEETKCIDVSLILYWG